MTTCWSSPALEAKQRYQKQMPSFQLRTWSTWTTCLMASCGRLPVTCNQSRSFWQYWEVVCISSWLVTKPLNDENHWSKSSWEWPDCRVSNDASSTRRVEVNPASARRIVLFFSSRLLLSPWIRSQHRDKSSSGISESRFTQWHRISVVYELSFWTCGGATKSITPTPWMMAAVIDNVGRTKPPKHFADRQNAFGRGNFEWSIESSTMDIVRLSSAIIPSRLNERDFQ